MAAVDRLVAQAQSDFGSDWGIHVEYKWIYKVLLLKEAVRYQLRFDLYQRNWSIDASD